MRRMRSFKVVVLPAPFAPRKPKISPRPTVKDRPSSARTLRLRRKPTSESFVRSLISTAGEVIYSTSGIGRTVSGDKPPACYYVKVVRDVEDSSPRRRRVRRGGAEG